MSSCYNYLSKICTNEGRMKKNIYSMLLILSALLIFAPIISYFLGTITLMGWLLIGGFIALAAITTLLSPLLTSLLMEKLAGQFIDIDFWSMMLDILNMIILPIVAGFIFNLFLKREATGRSKLIQLFT